MKRVITLTVFFTASFAQTGAIRVQPGDPLPGLTAREQELFRLGLEDFIAIETAGEGLGPSFNGNSCASCHSVPAVGGISTMTEVRAGYRDADGKFTALHGGTLYHLFSVPPHKCQVQIPAEANVFARRAPIQLFGDGLIEAIPDETIIALEDPTDRDGDGVKGRAARLVDVATGQKRIGRFGWKAQHATLLAFSADAYVNEMGITNDLFPSQQILGVSLELQKLCGAKPGIEDSRNRRTGLRSIDNFEFFMKFLAPIERGPVDANVRAGDAIFNSIGCAVCHTPILMTGPNPNPLFDRKRVELYSDLLLHDVDTGDGIEQWPAAANELRTPALWGLRFRRPLLHDGSAGTVEDAIKRHGGEANSATERFAGLSSADRRLLSAFLNSL